MRVWRRALVGAALVAALAASAADAATVTVYSSLPHVGATRAEAADMVRAERLALAEVGGRVGDISVRLVALNDGSRRAGKWTPRRASANARRAVGDDTAIAYVGEYNSGATAISLPILNEAGILQISPSNTYVGLTRAEGAGPGEPDKYYPSGVPTFGRVIPADHVQAAALARYLQLEGVRRVFLVHDREVYGRGLVEMVRARLGARGVAVAGRGSLGRRARNAGSLARRIRRAGADAMLYGGITENGAARLWRAVHRSNPGLKLFGGDGVAETRFTRRLGRGAAERTYLTLPTLRPQDYGPAGQRFFAAFQARYGRAPAPYAIYAYEAMSLVLDCIRRAGARGTDRQAVIDQFRATRDRDSVLGRYSIDENGDTTLPLYGGLRVTGDGALQTVQVIDSSQP